MELLESFNRILELITTVLELIFTFFCVVLSGIFDIFGLKGIVIIVCFIAWICLRRRIYTILLYKFSMIKSIFIKEKYHYEFLPDGITQQQFAIIADREARSTKRVESVNINGTIVDVTVQSRSKLSSWKFRLNFNYHGRIIGLYSYDSENNNSIIPKYVGDKIKREIEQDLNK